MYDSVLLSDVCLSRIMCRVWGRKRQGWAMKELYKGARADIKNPIIHHSGSLDNFKMKKQGKFFLILKNNDNELQLDRSSHF